MPVLKVAVRKAPSPPAVPGSAGAVQGVGQRRVGDGEMLALVWSAQLGWMEPS